MYLLCLLIVSAVALCTGCRDKQVLVYKKDFLSFTLPAVKNAALPQDVNGIIGDSVIILNVPNTIDVTKLVAAFELVNQRTIIKANGVVQESGVSVVNFTEPVTYEVKAEDRSLKIYKVRVEKSAAITKFGFYEGENPAVLFKDYQANIAGVNIRVNLPKETDVTHLAARFEYSSGATVKVNGVVQESGKTVQDFSSPVTYEVFESGSATGERFTVTVNFLTDPVWTKIGVNITGARTDGLVMAINPITNKPYIAYQRDGVENGVTIDGAFEKATVAVYTGHSWEFPGGINGFSEDKAEDFSLAFDNVGTPYISFKDFTNAEQKATVMRYAGGVWTAVGPARFSVPRPDYLSMTIGTGNVPFISMSARGGTPVPERGLYPMRFDGQNWNAANPPAGITCGTTQMSTANGTVYISVMERTGGVSKPSLYKWTPNAWATVGQAQFGASSGNGFLKTELAVGHDGEIYVGYQEAAAVGRLNHIMHYTGTTWEVLGVSVNVAGERDNFNIAVHPNGKLYLAYSDGNALYIKTFNKQINNWDAPAQVISGRVSEFDMQIAGDGVIYLVAVLSATEKMEVWKFDIP